MTDQLLTLRQVAAKLSCSYSWVWRCVKRGDLPTIRIGDGHRVSEGDLQQFLEARRNKSKS